MVYPSSISCSSSPFPYAGQAPKSSDMPCRVQQEVARAHEEEIGDVDVQHEGVVDEDIYGMLEALIHAVVAELLSTMGQHSSRIGQLVFYFLPSLASMSYRWNHGLLPSI